MLCLITRFHQFCNIFHSDNNNHCSDFLQSILNGCHIFCRVFWNEYYLADEYPRDDYPIPFTTPLVQDPAMPTHNVASAGLEDWAQFRRELSKWVAKLTL